MPQLSYFWTMASQFPHDLESLKSSMPSAQRHIRYSQYYAVTEDISIYFCTQQGGSEYNDYTKCNYVIL